MIISHLINYVVHQNQDKLSPQQQNCYEEYICQKTSNKISNLKKNNKQYKWFKMINNNIVKNLDQSGLKSTKENNDN